MKPLPKLFVCLWLVALISACAAPATEAPTLAPTENVAATTTAESNRVATSIVATMTAQPTATEPPPTATNTPAPTATEPPPTATRTPAPTATKVPPTATTAPTQVPPTRAVVATAVPATQAPVSDSIYSWTGGGPEGYTSFLYCSRGGGVACEASMAPGDIIFNVTLQSSADALEVIFYPFGLSVERDGANVADMYITADAGWLPPNSQAGFGVSRNFTVPGRYVVRTNGCLFTQANWASGLCNWWTLNGTVVTFDIR